MCQLHISTTPQPSPTPTRQSANNLMPERTKPDLLQWSNATLFIPVEKNLIQSINKVYFATWTNLTSDLTNKNLPSSMAISKGQIHQTRKNIKSTNQKQPMEDPPMKPLTQLTNTVFTNIINHKSQISTYLTGELPVTSNKGKKYLFVLYEYNSNSILICPMKARSDSKFVRFFKDLH